ncbi:Eco57I restriction-modification methylase domain-containing protein [Chryseobacterium sp. MEBOG07]|uniref:Eco57I restriction-modification methylase domain-containing protein n=1 Tax=Chryseobacterium sp. MEBOG07 TaxID=2879939 RepID=UPI001F019AEF|nr:Eco57I restriction-modification methylase domain-containing protein [Chryseobacterium sp. MEBOG07]UKB79561.1 Eco57I restriction-modification methylase domain-containing protein [Chryseobacterium sp. MEBOG07]
MNNKKNTGSYYTPAYLASFITKRVIRNLSSKKFEILEPSVGDGSFIEALQECSEKDISVTALDINKKELQKASTKWINNNSFIHQNFLDFASVKKFSAIIGNPPYIKKKLLTDEDLLKIKEIHFNSNLTENSISNIWTAFLIKSISLLKSNGIISFVLPSELLQVKYGEEIRRFLISQFERIEIFTFNDLMFECKGQDTIVVIGYKKHRTKGQYFVNIESQEQLNNNNFSLQKNDILVRNDTKWSHHFLNERELNVIVELKRNLNEIKYYIESKPGIVTAANDFFIADSETIEKYDLRNFAVPIIKRGLYVNGSVVFDNNNLRQLSENNIPTNFIYIKESDQLSDKAKDYIEIGEQQELHKRHKTSIRKKWYAVPNVASAPKAFFFKRSHLYPKLVKNNSDAYVTDSAYKIEMKENFNINSFIFSFYNSLTLLFAELEGRYYGGGVLELIPSEFKKLPIPFIDISEEDFNEFVINFENKRNIEEILDKYNYRILNQALGLTQIEIDHIEMIRRKLVDKRTRK